MSNPDSTNGQCVASEFAALWTTEGVPPDLSAFLSKHQDLSTDILVQLCGIDQANRWKAGMEWPVERYLDEFPSIRDDKRLTLELIKSEYQRLLDRGIQLDVESFAQRFPDLAEILRRVLTADGKPTGSSPAGNSPKGYCETVIFEKDADQDPGRNTRKLFDSKDEAEISFKPDSIGRYRVVRILGDGGFGRVYLAHDDVLNRDVAIKIPHRHLLSHSVNVELYLSEARIVSSLDHHSIVPVYDCGHMDDGLFYIVSKFIDGSDLATKIKRSPLSNAASAELTVDLAEALHFAHAKGVVHRDVKPANILIDSRDRAYLADFGIALRDEDFGKSYSRAGTVAYMSPEQLRGEGHLVDGRSDIFSLGVVLYELLTGKRPFSSNRMEHATTPIEPRPPRQFDASIPKELERICLKAMSYRVTDRYNAAIDMAEDLRQFLQLGTVTNKPPEIVAGLSGNSHHVTSGHLSTNSELRIVPKGLRSFDQDDANFFLELLPGPRDRNGLPDSIRFWKTRIITDGADTFRIGVVYGPSGSGKSSFLKAGVLPQLGNAIVPVYIESTPLDTEARLLKGLRRACPDLPADLGLAESFTTLRRQGRGSSTRRILIVIDQFEQWLHSRSKGDSSELLRALRQCDGVHLQCMITVRDDFWMALTHFMSELEVELVPGNNLAAVDLFSMRHARKVLTAIGQAYGVITSGGDEVSKSERTFINNAVADLAQNDQVIPVQLALFAEMVKDKSWTPTTLLELGGAKGVGERFLEETFNGRTALPHYRLHQVAARAVLKRLLPENSTRIKGAMRSYAELLEVSGYQEKSADFDALLRILDAELRLISPTDPDGQAVPHVAGASTSKLDNQFFHLTHDYLVPSLQSWLTRKQKESRQGRAELLLADRDSVWKQNPSNRSLPSFAEWLSILIFAGQRSRQESSPFLIASARYYGTRTILIGLILGLAAWGTQQQLRSTRTSVLVESLARSKTQDVPSVIESLEPYRQIANPLLRLAAANAGSSTDVSTQRLHAAMGLLPVDSKQWPVVYEGLLSSTPDDFATIRDSLLKWGDKTTITKQLWSDFEKARDEGKSERGFRAGAALATFDTPDAAKISDHWQGCAEHLSRQLVEQIRTNLEDFNFWVPAFRPARVVMIPELDRVFSEAMTSEIDRFAATTILADFAGDDSRKLTDVVIRATTQEAYSRLTIPLRGSGDRAKSALFEEFSRSVPANATREVQNGIEKRKAYAAIALLEFDIYDPLIAVLTTSSDSMQCTYAEDRLSRFQIRPETLYRMMGKADGPLRASLLRSLAGMSADRFSKEFRGMIVETVVGIFRSDQDSSVHSAAEWALRSWGLKDRLAEMMKQLATNGPDQEKHWYINHQGQTMVVFKGPIVSRCGSPSDEPGRDASDEGMVTRTINREFAVSSTEVTYEQFLRFLPDFRHRKKQLDYSPQPDCPIGMPTWYRAAEYCNWLSKKEDIPEDQWCYHAVKGKYEAGLDNLDTHQPVDGYFSKTGYRLLTEAEWEFACRAGTTTPFFWGNDPNLSRRYAQTLVNSGGVMHPVGSLCPNRFGLFDMHGNAAEWTSDLYVPVRQEYGVDDEPMIEVLPESERSTRGGSIIEIVNYQRSANRTAIKAFSAPSPRLGFRVARTLRTLKNAE